MVKRVPWDDEEEWFFYLLTRDPSVKHADVCGLMGRTSEQLRKHWAQRMAKQRSFFKAKFTELLKLHLDEKNMQFLDLDMDELPTAYTLAVKQFEEELVA